MALLGLAGCIPQDDPAVWPSYRPEPVAEPRLETEAGTLVDAPPPTWDGGAVVGHARTVAAGRYVVQPGDTLRGIGNRTGAGSEAIARANGLVVPYVLRPGQPLAIPGGRYHTVGAGETGIAIARAYGVPWREFVALNALAEPFILRIGQRLIVPQATALPPRAGRSGPDPAERARAFAIDIDDILTGSQPALAEGGAPAAPRSAQAATADRPVTTALATPASFAGRFAWPLEGRVARRFGRIDAAEQNDGIDIAGTARGAPARAAAAGVVAYAGDGVAGSGGLVLVSHGKGWITAYSHLETLRVVRGEAVAEGAVVGTVGRALHFEIRKDRQPVDPLTKLPPRP